MPTLTDKLTTEEDVKLAIDSDRMSGRYPNLSRYRDIMEHLSGNTGVPMESLDFWAVREFARQQAKIYITTPELDQLNAKFPVFAHISIEEPNMVAFTPDRTAGINDKQLRMAPGRLFQRFWTVGNERFIAKHAEGYLAQTSAVLEYFSGEQIVTEYKKFRGSVGACMSHSSGTQKFTDNPVHPAQVYVQDNIRMAVMRGTDGVAVARTLLRKKPDGTEVYIRCYGSPMLQRKLELEGFKPGNWVGQVWPLIQPPGVERNRTRHSSKSGTYFMETVVMPYLDADGKASGHGSNVICMDGVLQSIDHEYVKRLKALGVQYGSATDTGGYTTVPMLTSKMFQQKDGITGQMVNTMENTMEYVFWNGEVVLAVLTDEQKRDDRLMTVSMYFTMDGVDLHKTVFYPEPLMIRIGGSYYPNHEQTIRANGFRSLDREWYPNEEVVYFAEWDDTYMAIQTLDEDGDATGEARYAKREDTIRVVKNKQVQVRHKSELTDKHIKLHSNTRNEQVYAAPDEPVHKIPSGRLVAEGYNDIQQTVRGVWDLRTNLSRHAYMGVEFFFHKDEYAALQKEHVKDRRANVFGKFCIRHVWDRWMKHNWGLHEPLTQQNMYRPAQNLLRFWYSNTVYLPYGLERSKFPRVYDLMGSRAARFSDMHMLNREDIAALLKEMIVQTKKHIEEKPNMFEDDRVMLWNLSMLAEFWCIPLLEGRKQGMPDEEPEVVVEAAPAPVRTSLPIPDSGAVIAIDVETYAETADSPIISVATGVSPMMASFLAVNGDDPLLQMPTPGTPAHAAIEAMSSAMHRDIVQSWVQETVTQGGPDDEPRSEARTPPAV